MALWLCATSASSADHQGTSSFHAPMRKYPPPVETPDTSNANLDLDKKVSWRRMPTGRTALCLGTNPPLCQSCTPLFPLPRVNSHR